MVPLINEGAHPIGAQQEYDKNKVFKLISILRIVLAINVFPIPDTSLILTVKDTGLISVSLNL